LSEHACEAHLNAQACKQHTAIAGEPRVFVKSWIVHSNRMRC